MCPRLAAACCGVARPEMAVQPAAARRRGRDAVNALLWGSHRSRRLSSVLPSSQSLCQPTSTRRAAPESSKCQASSELSTRCGDLNERSTYSTPRSLVWCSTTGCCLLAACYSIPRCEEPASRLAHCVSRSFQCCIQPSLRHRSDSTSVKAVLLPRLAPFGCEPEQGWELSRSYSTSRWCQRSQRVRAAVLLPCMHVAAY